MKEKRYPIGWHPANEEEAVARIEAIEAEYERTGKATDFDEFIEEYRNLWKGLKVGSMGSPMACKEKMLRWMGENPNYTKEDILKAAKIYINSLNNYQYLQAAHYFIYKKDGKEEDSRLSAFIEEKEVDNTDWTTKLS